VQASIHRGPCLADGCCAAAGCGTLLGCSGAGASQLVSLVSSFLMGASEKKHWPLCAFTQRRHGVRHSASSTTGNIVFG